MEALETIINFLVSNAVSVVITLVKGGLAFFIGWKLAKWIMKLIRGSKGFQKLDDGIESFVGSLIEILLKAVVIMTVISILGINLSAAITALASVGLTFGLAFQGALSNFAGGFIILVFKPFKVGDYIDTHTDSGTVVAISIFHTKLQTPDNKLISVPNGALSNSSVINYSALPTRRLDFTFSVEYGSDVEHVKKVLVEIAESQPTKLEDKAVMCRLHSFGESGMNVVLRMWVKREDYWDTYFAVNEQVDRAFGENGIVIPLPQLDVHTK